MVQVSNYHASKHCFDTFRRDIHSFLCFQTANPFHCTSNIEYGEERKKINTNRTMKIKEKFGRF
jgi:hypothetical protein